MLHIHLQIPGATGYQGPTLTQMKAHIQEQVGLIIQHFLIQIRQGYQLWTVPWWNFPTIDDDIKPGEHRIGKKIKEVVVLRKKALE